jgi:MFS family permease
VTALEYEKHVPIQYNGAISSYGCLTYLATTVLTGFISHWFPKRIFIIISFAGVTLGLFVMGSSSMLGLPDTILIFLVGYGVLNAAQGFLFIPILPEMIESFCDNNNVTEGQDEEIDELISDRSAGLYGTFYYVGMIVSPIGGSLIYEHYKSFPITCDIFACLALGYTAIYFLFNIVPDWKDLWRKHAEANKKSNCK